MSHLGSSMDPYSLNIILFLKANKSLWEVKTLIDEVINAFEVEERIEVDNRVNEKIMLKVAYYLNILYLIFAF
jgi:hypothetical protein